MSGSKIMQTRLIESADQSSPRGRRGIAGAVRIAYTGGILMLPALLFALGCQGEPDAPPPEAADQDVEDIQSQMEGIDPGSEVDPSEIAPSEPDSPTSEPAVDDGSGTTPDGTDPTAPENEN
ncbi:MAG: hypothetical protein WDZ59_02545 [Pirellulales bacterium]